MKEFYANLPASVVDPDSPWFHKIYIQCHILELSPNAIYSVFKLPENNITRSIANLLKTKPSKIAKFIYARKASSFDRSEVNPVQLTLKFLCLFRVCSRNIFPTTNSSCLSLDMGRLIYAIDQHLEFIDFGHLVISKMLEYADGVVAESRILP